MLLISKTAVSYELARLMHERWQQDGSALFCVKGARVNYFFHAFQRALAFRWMPRRFLIRFGLVGCTDVVGEGFTQRRLGVRSKRHHALGAAFLSSTFYQVRPHFALLHSLVLNTI